MLSRPGRRGDPSWAPCGHQMMANKACDRTHYNQYPNYDYGTTEVMTTTEDPNECTDTPINGYQYPVPQPAVHSYRHPRIHGHARCCRPVLKRKSKRQFLPYSYYAQIQDPRLFQRDHRRSKRSLIPGPQRRKHNTNVAAYNTMPVYDEYAGTLNENLRKRSTRRMYTLNREAVDSSTSIDGKSILSTYSRLSVDVTNEMVAMNRDIENILSRYGSNFDQPADNELGERGRGYNGNNKPGSSGAWTQLTPQQRALLSMDKPPLERLGELPLDLLRPRPPGPSTAEKSDGNANMINHLLHDLMNRQVMHKLDENSLHKLQTILSKGSLEKAPGNGKSNADLKDTEQPIADSSRRDCGDARRLGETAVLSEIDKRPISNAMGVRPIVNVLTATYRRAASALPIPVDRSEGFIPISSVDSDKNWLKNLKEIQQDSLKSRSCEKCELASDHMKSCSYLTKLREDKSVNTDKELLKARESTERVGNEGAAMAEKIEFQNHLAAGDNLMRSQSKNSVRSRSTEYTSESSRCSSGAGTYICGKSNGKKDETKVTVEDIGDEERPLQRVQESTSIGGTPRRTPQKGRPNTPSALKPVTDEAAYNTATPIAPKDERQGGGDSAKMDVSGWMEKTAQIEEDFKKSEEPPSNDIDTKLVELKKSVEINATYLDHASCLNIIRKVTEVMLTSETVVCTEGVCCYTMLQDFKLKDSTHEFVACMRHKHLQHIINELNHLETLSQFSKELQNEDPLRS